MNRFDIRWTGRGEAGVDGMNSRGVQSLRDTNFFIGIQSGPWHLLAVAQRGVAEQDNV